MMQSGNIYFLIIGPMSPLKLLPAALACLLSLPTYAENAAGKTSSPVDKLTARLHTCAKPVWPAESLRREEEGAVILAFLIGMDGKVIESKVEKSSGHPLLDLAAQDGLAKCLFASPETIGRYEPAWTKMSYVWILEESESPAETQARFERDKRLAAEGNAEAIYNMSWRYFAGSSGLAKNVAETLRMLRKSAELGHGPAQSALAMLLFTGENVDQDVAQAIDWAKKAAAQGAAPAQVALATILFNAPEKLVDAELMFESLEKAVAQGDAEAQVMLGILLLDSEGAGRRRGLQLIVDAAEAQNRMAQHQLAHLYEEGGLLPQDMAKAKAWYERSAAGGFAPAQEALLRLQH